MITTRDIKVFIFSIFITTLCFSLFNNNPIKEAEAQGGMPPMGAPGMPPMGAPGMAPPGGDTYDLLQAHITGAIANHTLTQDRIEAHINGAVAKHAEMLEKLDALLAHLGAK